MPELPEVETVRRGLVKHMLGKRIDKVELHRPNLRFPFPEGMADNMSGCRVEAVERRAKYLLIRLSGGMTWMVHLGMSGYFSLLSSGEHKERQKHDHVVIHLSGGGRAVYNDQRRFGIMDLFAAEEQDEHRLLAHLGPEPLSEDWGPSQFCQTMSGRTSPIKVALLNQKLVAGLGNIYVCEALHRSGISPQRKSGDVVGKRGVSKRATALVQQVKEVLSEAIEAGGSTLRDFQSVDGELGYFPHSFTVYDREGEDCRKSSCKGIIARIVQAGRSTFYCPKCQK